MHMHHSQGIKVAFWILFFPMSPDCKDHPTANRLPLDPQKTHRLAAHPLNSLHSQELVGSGRGAEAFLAAPFRYHRLGSSRTQLLLLRPRSRPTRKKGLDSSSAHTGPRTADPSTALPRHAGEAGFRHKTPCRSAASRLMNASILSCQTVMFVRRLCLPPNTSRR